MLDKELIMNSIDVMIHINEQLNLSQQQEIENQLREVEGVIAPRFNKPHLLLIYYNTDKTNSSFLQNFVKAKGYQTQLVGM